MRARARAASTSAATTVGRRAAGGAVPGVGLEEGPADREGLVVLVGGTRSAARCARSRDDRATGCTGTRRRGRAPSARVRVAAGIVPRRSPGSKYGWATVSSSSAKTSRTGWNSAEVEAPARRDERGHHTTSAPCPAASSAPPRRCRPRQATAAERLHRVVDVGLDEVGVEARRRHGRAAATAGAEESSPVTRAPGAPTRARRGRSGTAGGRAVRPSTSPSSSISKARSVEPPARNAATS